MEATISEAIPQQTVDSEGAELELFSPESLLRA